jgi:RNA polymerase sigma-70 factor (ECF subfamily)
VPVGPPRELEQIYAAHSAFVRRVLADRGVAPVDLDDALQETFVTVHRLLPEFEGRSSMETWLYSVAWRIAANYRRRERRAGSSELLSGEADAPPESLVSPERVHASFTQIDEENRDLLALHEIGGLSISALSEMTGYARATIRQRLERSRQALRRALGKHGEGGESGDWIAPFEARFAAPQPLADPSVLRLSPDRLTCISTIDDTVLAIWRAQSSDGALQALIETLIDLAHAWPGGARYLAVVERTSSPPTRTGREMTTWITRKLGARMKAVATTIEGPALMTLVPAVLNTSLFLARTPVNMRFFGELSPTLDWLAQYGPLEKPRVIAQVARMRAALAPFPQR